jgi:hypothetical protein
MSLYTYFFAFAGFAALLRNSVTLRPTIWFPDSQATPGSRAGADFFLPPPAAGVGAGGAPSDLLIRIPGDDRQVDGESFIGDSIRCVGIAWLNAFVGPKALGAEGAPPPRAPVDGGATGLGAAASPDELLV